MTPFQLSDSYLSAIATICSYMWLQLSKPATSLALNITSSPYVGI